MWPTIDIVDGKMEVSLPHIEADQQGDHDLMNGSSVLDVRIGDLVYVEFREGDYHWLVVEEIQSGEDHETDIYYCTDKDGRDFEIFHFSIEDVDRSMRTEIGEFDD
tara:strand:+ start:629 stop:946 length:318 start_codon:yes stop_codon:yes gene_type:complete